MIACIYLQPAPSTSDVVAADIVQTQEARIAALERLVGRLVLENEFLKGASRDVAPAEKRDHVRHRRPCGLSVAEGCRLMGLARSTYYDEAARHSRSRRHGSSNASRRSAPSGPARLSAGDGWDCTLRASLRTTRRSRG